MRLCNKCGKAVRELRRGSFTAWIFRSASCTCHVFEAPAFAPPVEFAAPASSDHTLPDLGEKYQVQAVLGSGGMGTVYLARDEELDTLVAIKVLKPELAADPQSVTRFEQEASAVSGLCHPNLVLVLDQGRTRDNAPYIVMEYLSGQTLSQKLESGHSPGIDWAVDVIIQICRGLGQAHQAGVIHRDLKPSNVILTAFDNDRDRVTVVDFGIAKVQYGETRSTQNLTQTGDVFGTPLYMSPEQCLGLSLDERSDIYSLGCIFYELVSGRAPFAGRAPMQILSAHLTERPAPFETSRMIPGVIARTIFCCLEKEPQERYQDCDSLARDLEAIGSGKMLLLKRRLFKNELALIRVLGIAILTMFALATIPALLQYNGWLTWSVRYGAEFASLWTALLITLVMAFPAVYFLEKLMALLRRIQSSLTPATHTQRMKLLLYSGLTLLLAIVSTICYSGLAYFYLKDRGVDPELISALQSLYQAGHPVMFFLAAMSMVMILVGAFAMIVICALDEHRR